MSAPTVNAATHISIVWGVTLAMITLLEWNGLDRDPMRKQILSPFIERDISVLVDEESPSLHADAGLSDFADGGLDAELRYQVEFHFNGPLFLACFFLPVLAVHWLAWLLARLRGRDAPPQ